jgi:hypothetical protein
MNFRQVAGGAGNLPLPFVGRATAHRKTPGALSIRCRLSLVSVVLAIAGLLASEWLARKLRIVVGR